MESKLPVTQLAMTFVPCLLGLLTVFISRKSYFLVCSLLCVVYGVGYIIFPVPMHKVDFGQVDGVTIDHWSVHFMQHLGVNTLGIGIIFFIYRNSSDERVSKLLLSTFGQMMVGQLFVFVFMQQKVSKNVPVLGKEGKLMPATGLQIPTEVFCLWYSLVAIFLITTLVHYLKSPSPRPQAPARYDTQMEVHRAILSYSFLFCALQYLINPEMALKLLASGSEAKVRVDDFICFTSQLMGVYLLSQISMIRGSADFVSKDDQAAIFKTNAILVLVALGIGAYQAFYVVKLPTNFSLRVAIFHGVMLINSIAAIVRARKMELDLKESKKRK